MAADAKVQSAYLSALGNEVLKYLRREVGSKGILSLAKRWNCPLMWSHYGDEHRGLCIEYDLKDHVFDNLKPVNYKANWSIRVSELINWKVNRSRLAEESILSTYFLAKAPNWKYEKEWREVDDEPGVKPSSARVSAVYFGLRCDTAIISAIVKLHMRTEKPVKFYGVLVNESSFQLKRKVVDFKEILSTGLKTSARLDFRDGFDSTH